LTRPEIRFQLATQAYHYHSRFQQIILSLKHPPPIYSPLR
jgi:hypothetical protein